MFFRKKEKRESDNFELKSFQISDKTKYKGKRRKKVGAKMIYTTINC